MKPIFAIGAAIKWSIAAFAIAFALGLFSMGVLGLALYYPVYPMLAPFYGDPNDWHGDWVWPTIIVAGMGWSFSFLAAGLLNWRLGRAGWRPLYRRLVYAAMLWLGAAVIWWLLLWGQPYAA